MGETLSDQVRKLVRESGLSLDELADSTTLPRHFLVQFLHGEVNLSLYSIEVLAYRLDLEIRRRPQAWVGLKQGDMLELLDGMGSHDLTSFVESMTESPRRGKRRK